MVGPSTSPTSVLEMIRYRRGRVLFASRPRNRSGSIERWLVFALFTIGCLGLIPERSRRPRHDDWGAGFPNTDPLLWHDDLARIVAALASRAESRIPGQLEEAMKTITSSSPSSTAYHLTIVACGNGSFR